VLYLQEQVCSIANADSCDQGIPSNLVCEPSLLPPLKKSITLGVSFVVVLLAAGISLLVWYVRRKQREVNEESRVRFSM